MESFEYLFEKKHDRYHKILQQKKLNFASEFSGEKLWIKFIIELLLLCNWKWLEKEPIDT